MCLYPLKNRKRCVELDFRSSICGIINCFECFVTFACYRDGQLSRDGSLGMYEGSRPNTRTNKLWSASVNFKGNAQSVYELAYTGDNIILNEDGNVRSYNKPVIADYLLSFRVGYVVKHSCTSIHTGKDEEESEVQNVGGLPRGSRKRRVYLTLTRLIRRFRDKNH